MALAAIFMLAVISMLSSVFIADTIEGYAAAINQAGTLRMQSYRIANSLAQDAEPDLQSSGIFTERLVNEFNDRLFSPRIHDVLSKAPSQSVLASYALVEEQWLEKMHPLLSSYLELSLYESMAQDRERILDNNRYDYLQSVDCFVDDIHLFVEALEIDAERKNHQLRIIQIISLIFIVIVAGVSIFLAKVSVLKPLRELQVCANSARQGDFSLRSRYHKDDELGQLGQAFNVMAEDLSKMYEDLEQRVKDKTVNLERSNRSLELLYNTTRTLHDSSLSDEVLERVIEDVQNLLGWEGGTICLGRRGEKETFRLVTSSPNIANHRTVIIDHCEACLTAGRSQICQLKGMGLSRVQTFSTPIKDQNGQYGILMVELNGRDEMQEWQQRLLETVASHVALAINMAQQVSQTRLVSLLEERSAIARELHDSLAQSLSYLKIQVSRLEKAVIESEDQSQILDISKVLRSALNGAYRQLRDLLTTFRLSINDADFCMTLQETVEEFSKKGNFTIAFEHHLANCRLSPNAEIHLLQIIREALSNVMRHANATHARLSIDCDQRWAGDALG